MRLTTTIAMLLVAAGLGAYIWFVERGRPDSDERARGERRVVPGFDRDGAKEIALARDGERVVLKKDGDDWRLAEPIDAPADRGAVDRILSGVEFLDFEREVRDAGAAGQYGLGEPRARVEIESASATVALAAGAEDATGRGVYLAREGGAAVYVVEKHFLETLRIPLAELRDRKALRVTRSRVAAIAVESGGARWRAKRDKGLWRLEEPAPMAAEAERIDRLLTAIDELQATRYVQDAGAPAALGLDPPAARVEVDDGRRHALRLGGACGEHAGERYAARGEQGARGAEVFCVSEDKARALLVAPSEVELRRLVALSLDDLSAARISRGEAELRIEKKDDRWRIAAPKEAAADEEEARKWLSALGEYRAAETRPAGQAPAPAGARVELVTAEGATVAIAFGEPEGAFLWARRDGDGVELKLAAAVDGLLDPAPARFRDKQALSFSRYDARRIALSGGGLADEELAYADGKWTLARPAFPVDESLVDRNLGALADLKALRFASAAPAGAFASARRVEVTVEPPEWGRPDGGAGKDRKKTHVLEVGAALAGPDEGCWAKSPSIDVPFAIAKGACDDLRRLHGQLDLFDLDEEKLTGIAVKGPSLAVSIEKLGPDWHLSSGAAAGKEKVDALLASFRGRKARRLLRYGIDEAEFDPPRLVLTVKHEGRPDAILTAGRDLPDASPAGHAARLSSRDASYLLDASLVEEVESAAAALEDPPAPAQDEPAPAQDEPPPAR